MSSVDVVVLLKLSEANNKKYKNVSVESLSCACCDYVFECVVFAHSKADIFYVSNQPISRTKVTSILKFYVSNMMLIRAKHLICQIDSGSRNNISLNFCSKLSISN